MASVLRSSTTPHTGPDIYDPNPERIQADRRRSTSSHGDVYLDKQEVIGFPKVDPSKVTPEVHFQKDLGLDTLDNVEIVMALEEEFKLEIPARKLIKLTPAILQSSISITIQWLVRLCGIFSVQVLISS